MRVPLILNPFIRSILLVVCLTGCTQPLRYEHTGYQEGYFTFHGGFTEVQLDAATFRVSYMAPRFTELSEAAAHRLQFFLLYRCAELTLLHGHENFVVVDSSIPITVAGALPMERQYTIVRVGAGAWVGAIGRGAGLATGPARGHPPYRIQVATIRMFDGTLPKEESLAFDAQYLVKVLPDKEESLANAIADKPKP